MRKEGINPLTNDGQYADTTYKKLLKKKAEKTSFMLFVRRAFRRANAELMKTFAYKKF